VKGAALGAWEPVVGWFVVTASCATWMAGVVAMLAVMVALRRARERAAKSGTTVRGDTVLELGARAVGIESADGATPSVAPRPRVRFSRV
jgi:hypothetical protein